MQHLAFFAQRLATAADTTGVSPRNAHAAHRSWQPRFVASSPHLVRILRFDAPLRTPEVIARHRSGAIGNVHLSEHLAGWLLRAKGNDWPVRVNGAPTRNRVVRDGDLIEVEGAAYILRAGDARGRRIQTLHALATVNADLEITYGRLARLAPSDVPIIINGETGTGKELVARAIHELSGRPGRLVAVNCGALPPSLIESELFGCVRGAFSGADTDRLGLIRSAHGGTLFLDEIAELSLQSQVALLRVLQEREVHPVGATRPVRVDLRVVAATHRDLRDRIDAGSFREDLYARLAGYTATLPPLRSRMDDIGIIIADLLRKLAPERAESIHFDPEAARRILAHGWPRNIRELESALRTALILTDDDRIGSEHLPETIAAAAANASSPLSRLTATERAVRQRILVAVEDSRGNVSTAARAAGYSRSHFHRLLNRYGIEAAEFRRAR